MGLAMLSWTTSPSAMTRWRLAWTYGGLVVARQLLVEVAEDDERLGRAEVPTHDALAGRNVRSRSTDIRGMPRSPHSPGATADPPGSSPAVQVALREVVAGSGVGVGYVARGLLPIHHFVLDVRRALGEGRRRLRWRCRSTSVRPPLV